MALVVLSHAGVPWLAGASQVGVVVFFTLSGYLIATLLAEEVEATGGLRLGAFYRRRARRLLPALVAVVAVTGLFTVLTGAPWVTGREAVAALCFGTNLLTYLPPTLGGGMLRHTWTLAMEEQFYLLWPLLVLLLWRRRTLLVALLVAGCTTSLVLRCLLWDGGAGADRVLFGTDTRVDGILAGCLLAVLLRRHRLPAPGAAAVVGMAVVGLLALDRSESLMTVGLTVAAAGSALTIAAVVSGAAAPWLCGRGLVWLGRRSYGVYLWHHPMLAVFDVLGVTWPVETLVLVPASLVLAELSWRCIEAPFLARRALSSSGGHGPVAEHRRGALRAPAG